MSPAFLHPASSIPGSTDLSRAASWLLAALLAVFFLGVGVFDHELWPPTEQAVAGVTWEMLDTHDFVVPRIDGMAYLEKPPLAYAFSAVCCALAGRTSAGLVRLPSALFGLGALATIFWTCRRRHGSRVAWISTYICATTFSFYEITHRACTDSAALFFTCLCFALFARTLGDGGARRWRDDVPFCLALALSFYAKNFYTFLIVVPPVASLLVLTRQFRRLAWIALTCAAASVILVGPWAWALYERGGSEYLRIVFVDNTLGRFFTVHDTQSLGLQPLNDAYRVHKDESVPFFLAQSGVLVLPWVFVHAVALVHLFRKRRTGEFLLFLKLASAGIVAVLALSSSRVYAYLLPLLFPLTLCLADHLRELFADGERRGSWPQRILAGNLIFVAFVLALSPLVASVLLHEPLTAFLAIPGLLGVGGLLWVQRGRWHTPAFTLSALVVSVGSAVLSLWFLMPMIDAVRSWRPFFDTIRPELAGRKLYASYCDDRRLPAIEYYLERRVNTLANDEDALTLLAREHAIAIIVPLEYYTREEARFDALPHRTLRATHGMQLFVLVLDP